MYSTEMMGEKKKEDNMEFRKQEVCIGNDFHDVRET